MFAKNLIGKSEASNELTITTDEAGQNFAWKASYTKKKKVTLYVWSLSLAADTFNSKFFLKLFLISLTIFFSLKLQYSLRTQKHIKSWNRNHTRRKMQKEKRTLKKDP